MGHLVAQSSATQTTKAAGKDITCNRHYPAPRPQPAQWSMGGRFAMCQHDRQLRRVHPSTMTKAMSDEVVQLHKQRLEELLQQQGIELVPCGNAQDSSITTPNIRVDWSRYHLQLLFVDRTDSVRARVTAGLFERIAEWNGFGRALYTWHAGLDVTPQHVRGHSFNLVPGTATRTAAILSAASALQLSVRDMARPAEQFELDDLDRYDLVVCLDHSIRDALMAQLAQLGPDHLNFYKDKVCLLTSFSQYEVDSIVLARGGLALLPMQLSFLLKTGQADLSSLKVVNDIDSPCLSGEHATEEWSRMVQAIIWCTAGLVKFLLDAMPHEEYTEY